MGHKKQFSWDVNKVQTREKGKCPCRMKTESYINTTNNNNPLSPNSLIQIQRLSFKNFSWEIDSEKFCRIYPFSWALWIYWIWELKLNMEIKIYQSFLIIIWTGKLLKDPRWLIEIRCFFGKGEWVGRGKLTWRSGKKREPTGHYT